MPHPSPDPPHGGGPYPRRAAAAAARSGAIGPIAILLASFQGARHIAAQLASIEGQSYPHWRLIVSDDGSRDDTRAIIAAFAARHPSGQVVLSAGPGQGATRNFLHLIDLAPAGTAIAFCDQDDVWFPHKLARAAEALDRLAEPAHYAARTVIARDDLVPVTESRRFERPFGFRNALVQACMAGNTSVFNAAAARLLKAGSAAARSAAIESHDWWAYQLSSGAGARLIHDGRPALLYRQHARSEMGRNDTAAAMARRFGKLFAGDYGLWVAANLAALAPMHGHLTPENREILDGFAAALALPGPLAARRMRALGLYRHTAAGTAALYAAAAAGRLRQPRSPRIRIR
ncbi:glycosyltransferase [Paracoccus spongiarum]|uniref:Glycosyltransferase n=1 Tax=Paracoccus spongiarum TaxID=3064387 RepID=A0ABT9JDD9_9RHOB|nr:glycosyltransferase [Paracoccus sp. 2205BS29-5]MDP5307127.1 glycosyltransferase [Paracoccus sp. 2205BS29-5]